MSDREPSTAERPGETTIFMLDEGELVSCFHCRETDPWRFAEYGRGTGFLAGPGHTPFNGSANYVCFRHVDNFSWCRVLVYDATWGCEIPYVRLSNGEIVLDTLAAKPTKAVA